MSPPSTTYSEWLYIAGSRLFTASLAICGRLELKMGPDITRIAPARPWLRLGISTLPIAYCLSDLIARFFRVPILDCRPVYGPTCVSALRTGGHPAPAQGRRSAPTITRCVFHRITRSARASTFGGIVRPICLAAFRLMISSNFVGCSIGRSAGLVPLEFCRRKSLRAGTSHQSGGHRP